MNIIFNAFVERIFMEEIVVLVVTVSVTDVMLASKLVRQFCIVVILMNAHQSNGHFFMEAYR